MANTYIKDNNKQPRDKLGLALAGGGFRASLFHIGVLRRMAELDLLRYLEVLSTVSGGSIVGALYILLLKRELENKARLDQSDYLRIVDDLEQRMCSAIKKNLRMRLLMNPFGLLRVMLTTYSLGRRMSRLYERYIFNKTILELRQLQQPAGWLSRPWIPTWFKQFYAPGRILLDDIKIHPGRFQDHKHENTENNEHDLKIMGIEAYNQREIEKHGSAITQLIINATSLNSGSRFWFSAAEIGDWDHGNIRRGEISKIIERKKMLADLSKSQAAFTRRRSARSQKPTPQYFHLAQWWTHADFRMPVSGYESLFDDMMTPVIELMCRTEPGKLRAAKLPAWYLRVGFNRVPAITGGISKEQHLYKIITALGNIGRLRRDEVEAWLKKDPQRCQLMLEFIIELFLLRMAEHASPSIRHDWDSLTLGDAVAASANFPPMFPPFQLNGIYDKIIVSRLGLTDGGIFDNIGFTGLLDEHCNQIIVSDTGGPLNRKQRSSSGRLGMSARIMNILTSIDARQSKEYLLERYRTSTELCRELDFIMSTQTGKGVKINKNSRDYIQPQQGCGDMLNVHLRLEGLLATRELLGLAMFSIGSAEPYQHENPPVPAAQLAKIRTDLDIFGDVEMYALMNQGYINANHYINRYLIPEKDKNGYIDPKDRYRYRLHPCPYDNTNDSYKNATSPWEGALKDKETLLAATIKIASKRFFRALRMKLLIPWTVLILALGILIALTSDVHFSTQSLLQSIYNIDLKNTLSVLYFLPRNWDHETFRLSSIIAIVTFSSLLLYLITRYWFRLVDYLKRRSWISLSRFLARLAHWPQSYKGNLLWLIWLPLPILIVVTISILVICNHLLYYYTVLPKLRLNKIKNDS